MQTETIRSTKRTAKKPKEQTYSKDELDTLIAKAREEATEETEERIRAEIQVDDPPDNIDEPGLFSSSPYDSGIQDAGETQDIFTFCEVNFFNKGQGIVYKIQKDGQFVKEVHHPFSWSKVQTDFGGGNFRITAQDMNTKQYLKQQTQIVAEPPRKEEDRPAPQFIQPPPQPQLDPNNVLKFVAEIQSAARQEKLTEEKLERRTSTESTGLIIELVMKSSAQQQEMMMKMQESTNKMMEKLSENTNRMMEKMDDKFLKLLENSKPKETFGMKEYMDMQEKARDREEKAAKAAEDRMRTMFQYIDDKAEEKAEEKAGQDNDSGSMIGSLVKGVLPLLNAAAQNPALMAPQQPVQRVAPPQHRQPVATGPARPVRPTAPPRSAQRTNPAPAAPQVRKPRSPSRPGDAPVQARPVEIVNADTVPTLDQLYAQATPVQRQVSENVIPLIVENFHRKPTDCGTIVFNALKSMAGTSTTPKELLKEFSFDFVWQIARSFGIEVSMLPWFKEFYAYLEAASTPLAVVPTPESNGVPLDGASTTTVTTNGLNPKPDGDGEDVKNTGGEGGKS